MLGLFRSMVLVVLGASLAHSQSPIITKQPPTLVDAIDRHRVNLSVEASGSLLSYLWFHNDAHIAGATNATLSLFVRLTNAGTYHVVVSNSFSAVRGSNTLVRVVPDTFGPRVLWAVVGVGEINRILVSVDEDISFPGTNDFVVTEVNTGNRVPVTLAQVGVGNGQVRLTLSSNIDRTKNYQICFFNIADYRTNFIALNSCVSIGFGVVTNAFGFASDWSVYQGSSPPPPDWKRWNYVPAANDWYDASAMFYNSFVLPPACTTFGSMLSGAPPFYFRKKFTVTTNFLSPLVTAVLGRVVKGRAVFSLNNTEILQLMLPSDPTSCLLNSIEISSLLQGTNVLAVELSPYSPIDSDVAFDASLELHHIPLHRPRADGPVFLRHSNHSPAQLRLYWTNGTGYALEYLEALGDPWREFQPPSTNVLVEKAAPARFYRLNKRH